MSRSRLQILMAIIVAVIAVDQWTKSIVRRSLMEPREFLGGFLTLLRAENEGAFLSIGANLPPGLRTAIFSGLVGIALIAALFALVTGRITSPSDAAATAFIIGGGIGNLIDRVVFSGRVTDFTYLKLGPLHTGVFNVADVAITGGVLWLALSSFFTKKEESDETGAPTTSAS
jgi:signal peptidase II